MVGEGVNVIATCQTFATVWPRVDEVPGWLTETEALALFNAATNISEDGVIVEVGAFCGRSTTSLAETGRRVITIDPLQFGVSVGGVRIDAEIIDRLQSVVDYYPNVTWWRCKSDEAAIPPRIDLLYIDAIHKYPWPLQDFKMFKESIVPGGLVAFHDYWTEYGVTKSVDELAMLGVIACVKRAGSLFVGELL